MAQNPESSIFRFQLVYATFVFASKTKSFLHPILLLFNSLLWQKMEKHAQMVVGGKCTARFPLPVSDRHGIFAEHGRAYPANRTIHTTWAAFTFFHHHKLVGINGLWWLNDFISRAKTIRMIELEWLMLQSTEKKGHFSLFVRNPDTSSVGSCTRFCEILCQVLPDLAPGSAKSCTKFHLHYPDQSDLKTQAAALVIAGGFIGHCRRLHWLLQPPAWIIPTKLLLSRD